MRTGRQDLPDFLIPFTQKSRQDLTTHSPRPGWILIRSSNRAVSREILCLPLGLRAPSSSAAWSPLPLLRLSTSLPRPSNGSSREPSSLWVVYLPAPLVSVIAPHHCLFSILLQVCINVCCCCLPPFAAFVYCFVDRMAVCVLGIFDFSILACISARRCISKM